MSFKTEDPLATETSFLYVIWSVVRNTVDRTQFLIITRTRTVPFPWHFRVDA